MQGRMRIYHAVDQSDRTDGTGGHGDLRAGCFGLPDSHSSRLTRTPPPPAPEGDADAASAPDSPGPRLLSSSLHAPVAWYAVPGRRLVRCGAIRGPRLCLPPARRQPLPPAGCGLFFFFFLYFL